MAQGSHTPIFLKIGIEVCRAEAEKGRAFEEWLQRRDRVTYDKYRAQRVAVKQAVQAAKRMAYRRWESDWGMILRVTK